MRSEEEQRLQRELAKLQEQIDALSPEGRLQRSAGMREALVASGQWRGQADVDILEAFVRGDVGLAELAQHFNGRV